MPGSILHYFDPWNTMHYWHWRYILVLQMKYSFATSLLVRKTINDQRSDFLLGNGKTNYLIYLGHIDNLEFSSVLTNLILAKDLLKNNVIVKVKILVHDWGEYFIKNSDTYNSLISCFDLVELDPSQVDLIFSSSLFKDNPDIWFLLAELLKSTTMNVLNPLVDNLFVDYLDHNKDQKNYGHFLLILSEMAIFIFLKPNVIQMSERYYKIIDILGKKRLSNDKNLNSCLYVLLKDISYLQELNNEKASNDSHSRIFFFDNNEDIRLKINKAFCPYGGTKKSSILDWFELIIYNLDYKVIIKRPKKWGGNILLRSFEQLLKLYQSKELHPADLKYFLHQFIIESINSNKM